MKELALVLGASAVQEQVVMAIVCSSACNGCGALRDVLDDAAVVACSFCGAIYDFSMAAWIEPRTQHGILRRLQDMGFRPNALMTRFQVLAVTFSTESGLRSYR